MKIAVIGTGYVGLVTGTCFSEDGHSVVCVDTNADKIEKLNKGVIPIYEPGLDDLVERNVKAKRLTFTTSVESACADVDVVFLAVGTPPGPTGAADLSQVFAAAASVIKAVTKHVVLVTKSTVPVGTARKLWNHCQQVARHTFDIVSNPEFLKEGDAILDFMKPDRVVVGCQSDKARSLMQQLYSSFVRTDNPILFMDLESAELTKYVANAFLATKISFMNEMSRIAQATGADIDVVRRGISFDKRIGHLFMFPGVGYGGSCFPKDVKALIALGQDLKVPTEILDSVEQVNERQKMLLVEMLVRRFGEDMKGKNIAVWGIAFKPRTDDIREAPALVVMDELVRRGASVRATDPVAIPNAREQMGTKVSFSDDAYSILEGSDALLLLTEWNEFRHPDFLRIKKTMRTPLILDGRNVFDPESLRALGFDYEGVGRAAR